MSRRRLAWLWASWWVACLALWLLLTSTVAPNEVISGCGAATFAASAAVAVEALDQRRASSNAQSRRKQARGRQPRKGPSREQPAGKQQFDWVRRFAAVPVRVVVETALVTVAFINDLRGRRVNGHFIEVPVADPPRAAQRSSFETGMTILTCVAPNHVAVSFNDDTSGAVVHQLVRRRVGSLEEVIGSQ
jgi:hypothetical protein